MRRYATSECIRRWQRTWMSAMLVVGVVMLSIAAFAQEGRSPDSWFALVTAIQRDVEQADFEHRKIPKLDGEDRRFIRKMVNELAVSQDAKPTAAQGQWLISIRAWIDATK
jgi:hypothetical protein